MSNQFAIFVLAILTLISAVLSEIVTYGHCGNPDKCSINEVRIVPCPEAAQEKPCKLKRGEKAELEIDYTPNFSTNTMTAGAYWVTPIADLPLPKMVKNACLTTSCPVEQGNKQTYTYDINLSTSFPKGKYPVKWNLVGEEKDDACCIKFYIDLK